MRAHCNLCDEEFPAPQEGERVDETEIGRHLMTVHKDAFEMALSLTDLLGTL